MLESFGVINVGTFILGAIGIMIAPGPNSLVVVSMASRFGKRAGVQGMAGVFLGDAILMTIASAGAASAVALNPDLFAVIVYLGAGYLSFLGLRVLISQVRPKKIVAGKPLPAAEGHFFWKALLVALANPNTILFYLSFFMQFISPSHAGSIAPFIVLATIVETVSMSYLGLLVVAGATLAAFFRVRPLAVNLFKWALGLLFLGFGIRLLIGGLPG